MSAFYLPRHVSQRDPGDPRQFSHCWAASGAWMLDGATDGASRVDAQAFAKQAGGGSGRRTGSGTHEDIVQGLNRYGVKADILDVPVSDMRAILSTERRAIFSLSTAYEAWPVALDCMGGTAGPDVNHEIGVICGVDDKGTVDVMNPLCEEYQRVPLDDVIRAAAKYAKEQGHSRLLNVVRVYRQRPTSTVADRALIASQRDQLDQWQEYQVTVRQHAHAILDTPAPK